MSELKLIDISYHNGEIDFAKVKTQVDGAVIRCGYGDNAESQDDKKFKEYTEACITHDIPFGFYLYSYATTMDQAKSEADHCLRLLAPYKDRMSYPVYLDLEKPGTECGAVERALTFGEILEREGYVVGIYASEYWWNTYLSGGSLNRYTKWVAKYGTNDGAPQTRPSVDGTDIWQYTSVGKVNGISGNVDINICYRDLPSEIRPVETAAEPAQTPAPQPAPRTYVHAVGEHVVFSTCYASSTDPTSKAIPATSMSRNHGMITKIVDAANPYLLDNGLCWVNDGDIRGLYTAPAPQPVVSYYQAYTGTSTSIVDALKAVGVDSSFANRNSIAGKNGISNYSGTAEQNEKILALLRNGKLIK